MTSTRRSKSPHPDPLPGGEREGPGEEREGPAAKRWEGEGRQSVARARGLRRRMTDAERLLWRALRNRALAGHKFRRQHPIGQFIADFACPIRRLVIELDGGQHADRREQDDARTRILARQGYRVLRFWNNEVLNNLAGVLETIGAELARTPHPGPLPVGEREAPAAKRWEGEGLSSSAKHEKA